MTQVRLAEEDIFKIAREIPAAHARTAYLHQVCSGDPTLLARVVALLQIAEENASFLERPQAQFADTPGASPMVEKPGDVIGQFKLIELIGEGGMGTVWVAQQSEPVKRLVAIKLIKPGMDSKQVIARFEVERQALALMDHPNIARVLEGGATNTGRPYFVMDLVKGVPITKYCDEHHLTPRQRLELFIPICQAIQHAHHKGIIHRDLKPSNVLVALYDGRPVPKVIDFGVAKAAGQQLTDKTLVTGIGNIVGTLEYMSPEQAEINQLDIDTRSDIYSLGVLLYELLTGGPPFTKKELESHGMLEMLRVIREQEPPKPSTKLSTSEKLPTLAANRGTEPAKLARLMRGELDWVVMKALEKDRHRRYETASGLALEIERYLAGEPVLAHPPSAVYRLRKFARRHKVGVAAAALGVLIVVVGLAGLTVSNILVGRERDQKDIALKEREAALIASQHATATAEIREAETNAVLDFVEKKIFAAARPEGAEGGLGHNVSLRDAIESALPFVEESFKQEPLIEARLRRTLGKSFLEVLEPEKAYEQFEMAGVIRTERLGADHPETLKCVADLGVSLIALGRHSEALKLYEELVAKGKLEPDDPELLGDKNNIALCHWALGNLAEAVQLQVEVLATQKVKLGYDHIDTLGSMVNLSASYEKMGRRADAVALLEEALPIMKSKFLKHAFTMVCMWRLADNYGELARHADAYDLWKELSALTKTKFGPNHRRTLECLNALALSATDLGNHGQAQEQFEEALPVMKDRFGLDDSLTMKLMHNLANCYSNLGRGEDALKLHEECLELRQVKLGLNDIDTFASRIDMAACYRKLRRYDDAVSVLEGTLPAVKEKFPNHRFTFNCMQNLARTYDDLGRIGDAVRLWEELVTLRKVHLGSDHPTTVGTIVDLATCYHRLGRSLELVELSEELVLLRKAQLGLHHVDTLTSMMNLAVAYSQVGRHADAMKLIEETLEICKAQLGLDHELTLHAMHNLGVFYAQTNRGHDAARVYEETIRRKKAKLGVDDPDTWASMHNLAQCYYDFDRYADAAELLADVVLSFESGSDEARKDVAACSQAACSAFVLAMARWQIGEKELARKSFEKGLKWIERGTNANSNTMYLRAAAAKLLGVNE